MSAETLRQALEAAYLEGFNDSAEGYNGEYPFRDHGASPLKDQHWIRRRDAYVRTAIEQAEKQEPVYYEVRMRIRGNTHNENNGWGWGFWESCSKNAAADYENSQDPQWEYEVRRLYTTPPAAPVQEPVADRYCCHSCFKTSGGLMLDRMILCSECGNKRCPKANDHRNACTNSNEPGQPGSAWEHLKPAAQSTCSNALRSQGLPYPRTCEECGLGPCKHLATLSADHPKIPEYPQSEGLNDPALEYAKNVPASWTPEEVRLWQGLQIEFRNKTNLRKYALELREILQQTMSILNAHDRVYECAQRLVEHADFRLGGALSADSKARDIPSNAVSQVKARHLAALRDALAAMPKQEGGGA